MSGFIYYKPGREDPTVTLEQLEEWGIGYAFEKPPCTRGVVMPEGGAGILIGNPESYTDGLSLGYHPKDQVWEKVPGTDCLVGHYKQSPPTNSELERTDTVLGYKMPLQDGQDWLIPKVVSVREGKVENSLPCRLNVDDEGKICPGEPIAKYQYLWNLAIPYIDTFLVPELETETTIENDQVLTDSTKLLQVNYRIGIRETVMLDIFTREIEDKPLSVILCAIDYPTWIQWSAALKKSKSQQDIDGYNMSNGCADSLQTTSRLLPT